MKSARACKLSFGVIATVCVAFAAAPKVASAATTTASFIVSTTVQTSCVISATPMQFGAYVGTDVSNSTSTITVQCSATEPYDVGLNAGTATGATVTTRQMTGPGNALLNYGLYTDFARTVNWGDTVGTDTVSGIGTGNPQNLTVYGQIPAGQGVASGDFTDTIIATVTF